MKVKAIIIAMGLAALASTSAFAADSYSVGERASVVQFGNGNAANVDQQASSYDDVKVQQTANGATATVTSTTGAFNKTDIKQNGVGSDSKLSATVTQDRAYAEQTRISQS